MTLVPAEQGALAFLVVGIEDEGERGLEPIGNLMLVRRQREVGRHHADDRRDDIARYGSIRPDLSNELNLGRIEKDFLMSFAKRSGDCALAVVHPAAGK